jgi:hypothetical protein
LQIFTISSFKETGKWFKMKPVLCCCISFWIWCAFFLGFGFCNVSCKVGGGGGLKYNGSCFFGNQFIHYLKKCEALVEGKGINVFRIRKVSVVYALDWILRNVSRTSVGFPFASGLYVGGKCCFCPLATSSRYSQ